MSEQRQISLTVMANGSESLSKLFSTESLAANDRASISDDAVAEVKSVVAGAGMTAEEVLVNVVISLSTGVPASLIASWIYDKLKSDDVVSIQIDGKMLDTESCEKIEDQLRDDFFSDFN